MPLHELQQQVAFDESEEDIYAAAYTAPPTDTEVPFSLKITSLSCVCVCVCVREREREREKRREERDHDLFSPFRFHCSRRLFATMPGQIIEYNAKSDFYGLGYDPYTASGAANLRGWLRNSFFAKSLHLFFLFENQKRSWLERETK